MDSLTLAYRQAELKKLDTEYCKLKTKIKLIKPNRGTKWLDIEDFEFKQIKDILLGKH